MSNITTTSSFHDVGVLNDSIYEKIGVLSDPASSILFYIPFWNLFLISDMS
jgi:hypothetical protein